jgi:hypothetical protein
MHSSAGTQAFTTATWTNGAGTMAVINTKHVAMICLTQETLIIVWAISDQLGKHY